MVSQDELLSIAASAFGEAVTRESSQVEVQGWDSLSHLSLLTALDDATGGAASALDKLAGAKSIEQIIEILRDANLFKD
jgi:acyl carrier protein